MKKEFVVSWKKSVKPRKQRKFRINAPLHIKRKFLNARLSEELTAKHKTRSMPVRKGDKVKIARGQFSGKIGKVDHIDTKNAKIFVEGTERIKTDGTKSLYPMDASNVIIVDLVLEDKHRKKVLDRKAQKVK